MCAQSYTVLASVLPSYLYLFNKNKINQIKLLHAGEPMCAQSYTEPMCAQSYTEPMCAQSYTVLASDLPSYLYL